jgi:hypothetical protein
MLFGALAFEARSAPPGARPRGSKPAVQSKGTVKLILGSQKKSAFPKKLAAWRHQLTRPPFSVFKSFKVLKNLNFTLTAGRPVTALLVGPYVLSVKLINRITTRKGKTRYRFQLKLTAKRKRRAKLLHSSRMLLDKGGTFFLAGPRFKSGTLILGIALR